MSHGRLLERAGWLLVIWGRASYQIGDDPKSFLSAHSIIPWRSLGIFCEITSVVAMPTALVDLPASELSGDISAKARESH